MISVGAYEAKTHLPHLLDEVAKGERVTITRHGVPVAVLSPVDVVPASDRRQAIIKLQEFRRGKRAGMPIKAMIEEGRR